jgi:uncharacterized protein (DUF2147 family)
LKKVAVLLLLLVVAGLCSAADPVEGFWLSVDEKTNKVTAGWYIYEEGGKLYGKILSMTDFSSALQAIPCKETYPGFPIAGKVNQMLVVGTPWIFGLSRDRQGEWSGGNIINAEDGKMYKCKIRFHAADGKKFKTDVLEMRGEIGFGIGRSQYWQKSDELTASSLYRKDLK